MGWLLWRICVGIRDVAEGSGSCSEGHQAHSRGRVNYETFLRVYYILAIKSCAIHGNLLFSDSDIVITAHDQLQLHLLQEDTRKVIFF